MEQDFTIKDLKMISRFTIIKGIGRFHDCQFGGKHFNKNTIIFGQNTGGKSTLTSILWSFKTGDTAFIEGRRTFGSTCVQQVELFDDKNKSFKFPGADWNLGFENIEIFDTQFIDENIFEGGEITYDHQKKLNSIIVGPEGKRMANEINTLQDELSELTSKKTAKTAEFNRVFKKEITIKDFTSLPKFDKIDEKIKEINSTIEKANDQEKIKSVLEVVENLITNILNQNTKSILSSSIEVKAGLVAEHIAKTWKNQSHSKDFLQTGLSLTKDSQNDCVFCGQELDENSKKLLAAYSQLFSAEYRALQANISIAISKFEKWNPVTFLESLQDKLEVVKLALNLSVINKDVLKELKDTVNAEFSLKISDIGYTVNFDKYDSLIQIFNVLKLQIEDLKIKNIFPGNVNIEALRAKIKEFELSNIRHTPEWEDFLKENNDIDSIQEEKKVRREATRELLNTYSRDLFDTHLDTINKVLLELNADFIICDFQPIKKIVGQSERIFALTFFNAHKVLIDENAANKPNFKNTLSESDKRVLAFAFFYSLMIHDEKLNQKIIVFDDPFSSFDSDRRTRTVQLLANPHLITSDGELIPKVVDQLIIFTHEAEFFKWIFQKLDNPKSFRICPDGHNNGVKKSTLIDCDVDKEFIEDKTKRDLKEIQLIHSSNRPITDYEGLCVKCRKILESIFTRKYLFDLDEDIRSRRSIRSFVKKLGELGLNDFDKTPKQIAFTFLCDNLNIELHENTLKNEGENAHNVLGDFLKHIKEI